MDYKKKYENALPYIKDLIEHNVISTESAGKYFPELKESDDEKIRKELIAVVNDLVLPDEQQSRFVAWLEKQGEQKQDPCDNCKDVRLNCHNFPCTKKRAFKQGKSALEAIKEEKVDNANKVEPRQEKLTKFEKAVKQVMEEAIECGDTRNLKADAEMLLSLVQESAWSKEDELYIRELESLVKQVWATAEHKNDKDTIHKMSDLSFFLKTLKPQSTWQPSDEQMEALEHFVKSIGESGYASPYENNTKLLYSLLEQLKKLREK